MRTTESVVRKRQAPLRELYAKDPEEAITVKRVRTANTTQSDAVHGVVLATAPEYPDITWTYGTDRKVGGLHDAPNAGEILCAALAACLDNIIRMVADQLGVRLADLEVEVVGDVDVRGCLGMDPAVRPGFRAITADVRMQAETDQHRQETLASMAQRFCVTLDTLRNGVPVDVRFHTGD